MNQNKQIDFSYYCIIKLKSSFYLIKNAFVNTSCVWICPVIICKKLQYKNKGHTKASFWSNIKSHNHMKQKETHILVIDL